MQPFFFALMHLDPIAILRAGGYVGLAAIIFAETGILLGIIFPGDSLLFAAGLLAALGFFNPLALATTAALAAVLGGIFGYWFGKRLGPRLFAKEDALIFKRAYVARTQSFFEKYGARAILLARFVPIVRAFAPVLAGVGSMPYRRFFFYNLVGGIAWGAGMVALGYALGSIIPNSEHYILPLSLLVIVISFLPILINILRGKSAV
jgi:membrane-associated protein